MLLQVTTALIIGQFATSHAAVVRVLTALAWTVFLTLLLETLGCIVGRKALELAV